MPPPDACLILAVTAASLAAYLLWVLDASPRLRTMLVLLAVAALIATVIAHDVETANIAAGETAFADGPS